MFIPPIKPISSRRLKQLNRYSEDSRNKAWRDAILARDGSKCQWPNCQYHDSWVQIHHIKKYSTAPHLRYDLRNGITLCATHHSNVTGQEERWEMYLINIVNSIYKRIEKEKKGPDQGPKKGSA